MGWEIKLIEIYLLVEKYYLEDPYLNLLIDKAIDSNKDIWETEQRRQPLYPIFTFHKLPFIKD